MGVSLSLSGYTEVIGMVDTTDKIFIILGEK